MQRLLATLLMAALIIPATLKVGMLVNYVVLYDRYVTELCENRDRPAMQCNGQCHLAKELKSVDSPATSSEEHTIPTELSAEIIFLIPELHERADLPEESKATHRLINAPFVSSACGEVIVPPPEHIA